MTPPPGLPRANDSVPPIVTAIKDSQVATGSGVVNYISSFADRYLLGLALFAVILWVFQAYIFRRFSCRTTTDVQEKRDNLEVVFSRIPHDLSGTPDARQLKGRQLELNERASNIIINSIRLRKTWWRHCELFLGFLPTLLYAVVT
ncbi:hypothetical protein WG66_014911 [Moniliophthora roreri]|nr:hypothetical protein WG66_014911 [Moniliophthora roreri]